jgi:hypothetical protein
MRLEEEYGFETYEEAAIKLQELFEEDDVEQVTFKRSPMGLYWITVQK